METDKTIGREDIPRCAQALTILLRDGYHINRDDEELTSELRELQRLLGEKLKGYKP